MTKAQGAYLGHLNVETCIDRINESLEDVLAKIKVCDIDTAGSRLTDFETRINNLYSSIEKEKIAHRQLISTVNECNSLLDTTKEILEALKIKNKTLLKDMN